MSELLGRASERLLELNLIPDNMKTAFRSIRGRWVALNLAAVALAMPAFAQADAIDTAITDAGTALELKGSAVGAMLVAVAVAFAIGFVVARAIKRA